MQRPLNHQLFTNQSHCPALAILILFLNCGYFSRSWKMFLPLNMIIIPPSFLSALYSQKQVSLSTSQIPPAKCQIRDSELLTYVGGLHNDTSRGISPPTMIVSSVAMQPYRSARTQAISGISTVGKVIRRYAFIKSSNSSSMTLSWSITPLAICSQT